MGKIIGEPLDPIKPIPEDIKKDVFTSEPKKKRGRPKKIWENTIFIIKDKS